MNVNGVSLNQSGLQYNQGTDSVTVSALKRIRPTEDNDVDLGSPTKRFKTIHYTSLNPSIAGAYLPLAGGTMSGAINMNGSGLTNVVSITQPSANSNIRIGNTIANTGTVN